MEGIPISLSIGCFDMDIQTGKSNRTIDRVQALIENGLQRVPDEYIQPPGQRPAIADHGRAPKHVPVIDLFDFDTQHLEEIRQKVGQACKDWGAFQIINHGVPLKLLEEMKDAGLKFFNRPIEEKLQYACNSGTAASEGYGSRMLVKEDQVLDWRDYFDHHTLPISRRNPDRWPHNPASYRDTVHKYSEQMKLLAQRLLVVISESLGLLSSYIQEAIGEPFQNITVSYYPPCPQPELALGLQAHSDMGAITLLIQDEVGGLQVFKDGEWVTVQPLPDAIVVNLGDQTQLMPGNRELGTEIPCGVFLIAVPVIVPHIYFVSQFLAIFGILSNGAYHSVEHRAIVNALKARLSVATFYDPSKQTRICPAPELITGDSPPRYREVLYGDYVSAWYTKGPEGKRIVEGLAIDN